MYSVKKMRKGHGMAQKGGSNDLSSYSQKESNGGLSDKWPRV